ncbi:transaldolase [Frischella sp. Ac48]|uniref:transaldolase n=1 Tax=Frischella sp. Ac48 TaxID=2804531 RepID=UPI001C7CCE52|nr:transaldolase [Frischella sp. Ac48]MBX4132729.1 transaldolase [Frischella sp. Ac48]
MSQLDEFKHFTVVVADTGDIDSIKQFAPEDATTNPSLILKAAQLSQYQSLIDLAIETAKTKGGSKQAQLLNASDQVAVNIGVEILKIIPGRISTEVDARLSFDKQGSIDKAHKIIKLYQEKGIDKSRILIKIAATWEGIKAAEYLEKEGINCNLTLLFSFAQARACAEAGVFLISPFVGRIYDWYQAKEIIDPYIVDQDPGVVSVRNIYNYYKQHGYKTIVMGASFRKIEQILALTGCDRLTIAPDFLATMKKSTASVSCKLSANQPVVTRPNLMSESEFRWQHNSDAMAVEKLAEGIRVFAIDQGKLEAMLANRL